MGAKAIYTDLRSRLINDMVIANDVKAIAALMRDRNEFYKFVSGWKKVNLDEYVEAFVGNHNITGDNYNVTHNLRKISFWDDGKGYEIVCAMGGKYFRIQRQPYTDGKGYYHGAEYVDLNLETPRVPGNLRGNAAKAEFNRLTHFAMTYRKGTVQP